MKPLFSKFCILAAGLAVAAAASTAFAKLPAPSDEAKAKAAEAAAKTAHAGKVDAVRVAGGRRCQGLAREPSLVGQFRQVDEQQVAGKGRTAHVG